MAVDNDIYKVEGDLWWNEHQPLNVIRTALNPARLAYLDRVFQAVGYGPAGLAVVDIGCGGGLLAEELAHRGARVIGVDPAEASLRTARTHAAQDGLTIDYRFGAGEHLPVEDASVDIACCVDVLEHVDDVDLVLSETARVLKPGGVYVFDTINRTALSKLVMIKLCQNWSRTAWMPANLHDWDRFITPDELRAAMARAGLDVRDLVGLSPGPKPPVLYRRMRQLKKGLISHAEFGRRTEFTLTEDLRVSYIGYAVKVP